MSDEKKAAMKPQSHRMNLRADHLASLIGGVYESNHMSSRSIGDAVKHIERQMNGFVEEYLFTEPTHDVAEAHHAYRSHVDTFVTIARIAFDD